MKLTLLVSAFAAAACLAQTPTEEKPQVASDQNQVQRQVRSSGREMSLQLKPSGEIELTITEEHDGKQDRKTYKADSIDEFKKQYPEVAERYQIERLASPRQLMSDPLAPGTGWDDWKRSFEDEWFWDRPHHGALLDQPSQRFHSPDLDRWFDAQRQLFERFRAIQPPADAGSIIEQPDSARLGVMIGPVGPALAEQLNLDDEQAVLVMNVESGSRAEQAGLKRYDVIQKLNGEAVGGPPEFRDRVRSRGEGECKLDILRHGKPQQITVPAKPKSK